MKDLSAETGQGEGNPLEVVFGSGPVGQAVARALLVDGRKVKMISKSGRLPGEFVDALGESERSLLQSASVDLVTGDPASLASAVRGAATIYHCVSTPYQEWHRTLAPIQDSLVAAAVEAGALLAVADNLYGYARGIERIDEDSPVDPPSRKGRLRARLHEALLEAAGEKGLRFVSIRASDFYGPGVTWQGVFGTTRFLDPLIAGKRPALLGNPDLPHSYSFIDDFGRALVLAAHDEKALGRAWIVPNDRTLTSREVAAKFAEEAGVRAGVSALPRVAVSLAGLFNPLIREVLEVLYQKEEPYIVDGSRFKTTFDFTPTPLEEGIRKTLAWYRVSRQTPVGAGA